ncbi:MAG: hypothetical protein AB7G80_07325 [Dongiaceae bacterium]
MPIQQKTSSRRPITRPMGLRQRMLRGIIKIPYKSGYASRIADLSRGMVVFLRALQAGHQKQQVVFIDAVEHYSSGVAATLPPMQTFIKRAQREGWIEIEGSEGEKKLALTAEGVALVSTRKFATAWPTLRNPQSGGRRKSYRPDMRFVFSPRPSKIPASLEILSANQRQRP